MDIAVDSGLFYLRIYIPFEKLGISLIVLIHCAVTLVSINYFLTVFRFL